jgi:N-terminal acetyltransferase B complex non-catalytic subunit
LTAHERLFCNYATALAEWLEPYHDHARPPPATVLAEAMKHSEQKTGKPLKGIELPLENSNTNGDSKKDEEAPSVTPPPAVVTCFFDGNRLHFRL